MRYCKKCVMPETRPGLKFNDDGVCFACTNYENRKNVDWDEREDELEEICDQYRTENGEYDCLIPVSGGKDSHRLVHIMKKEMNMNPLLAVVSDPFEKTKAGVDNLDNLLSTFDCDKIQLDLSREVVKNATRIAFEDLGEPLKFLETAIYNFPIKIANKYDIPLVVYGENPAYEFGTTDEENKYADDHMEYMIEEFDLDYWLEKAEIDKSDLNQIQPPEKSDIENITSLFMSYFKPWNGYENYQLAKRYGFKSVEDEWERPGHIESYDQIDSVAYIMHNWMKFPKFGFARTTDIASRWIRWGVISREEAKRLVMERDGKVDQRALSDFCDFCEYEKFEFWDIAEEHFNRVIFHKNDMGEWKLKDPIYDDLPQKRSRARSLDGVPDI